MNQTIDHVTIWDGGEGLVSDGSIRIRDGQIRGVFPAGALEDAPCDRRIDGTGKLAIPGLICAHTHLYSALARGLAIPGYAPATFTQILEQLWWRLDKALDDDSLLASGMVGAMEAARCGITTLIDHHASPHAVDGSLDLLRDAVCNRVGLRGAFCYEVSDRDGPSIRAAGIRENARFLADLADDDTMCAGHFGLHASFTLEDDAFEEIAATLPDNAGVHIHVAEGPEDEAVCRAEHGMTVVERLDRHGLLRPSSILVHCLHVDDSEKDLIADRGAVVVHNPRSNMNNAVGSFDLDGFLDRGIVTGLGTDGLGANLLAELFTAGIAQKHTRGDCMAGGFDQLDRLLFRGNPEIAKRVLGIEFGQIVPDAPADIALLDYVPPTPLTAGNLLGHLLFGVAVHALRVADLFVAGRQILANGRFVDLDEGHEYAAARHQAQRLWQLIG